MDAYQKQPQPSYYPVQQNQYAYSPVHVVSPPKKPPLYQELVLAFCLTFFPLAVATFALIVLVFSNILDQSLSSQPIDSTVYLVDKSITTILTASSWCATVVVLIPGLLMVIFSYNVALRWTRHSVSNRSAKLPTPYQFSTLVQLLSYGGLSSLFKFIKMKWATSKSPHRLPGALKASSAVLMASLLLGYAITAADTWLHITSSAVEYSIVQESSASHAYGRSLSDECVDFQNTKMNKLYKFPCTLNPGASTTFMTNASEAILTLYNSSSQHAVLSHDDVFFLGPSKIASNIDYRARSIGVKTVCRTRSRECEVTRVAGAITSFDCAGANFPIYKGNLENITNADKLVISNNTDNSVAAIWFTKENPFRSAHAVYVIATKLWRADQDIVATYHGGSTAIEICETEILNISYLIRNNSISILQRRLADGDHTAVLSGPLAAHEYWSGTMQSYAIRAMLQDTIPAMEKAFADSVSHLTLSLSSGVMSPVLNDAEWIRESKIIARVPKAPLFTLVILAVSYCALILSAAIGALVSCFADGDLSVARECFTFEAMAKGTFEGKGILEEFRELEVHSGGAGSVSKVGMVRNTEGHRLALVNS